MAEEKLICIMEKDGVSDEIRNELMRKGLNNVVGFRDPRSLLDNIRRGLKPNVVIGFDKMPYVNGVELLEITSNYVPNSIRILLSERLIGISKSSNYVVYGDTTPEMRSLVNFIDNKLSLAISALNTTSS